VDFYDNAADVHETAEILAENGKYRMSVFNACLAIELYLKSRLSLAEGGAQFELSHDVVNIYRCLNKRFAPAKDLYQEINYSRKYFNESRYPSSGTEIFTKEFALEFLEYADDVKNYVDNKCVADIEDLKDKFTK